MSDGRDYGAELLQATQAGDVQSLAQLAMRLLLENQHLRDAAERERARLERQNVSKRARRAARKAQDATVSRDVQGQARTGADSKGQSGTLEEVPSPLVPPSPPSLALSPSTPPYNPPSLPVSSDEKPSPGAAEPAQPANPLPPRGILSASWPAHLASVWGAKVGAVTIPRAGKALKPLVDKHGVQAVEDAMCHYIGAMKAEGRTLNLGWFAAEGEIWVERAKRPVVVDGWMSDEVERLTRPRGMRKPA